MSDNFLSAEKPKQETDTGWIEYAILKFWEDCQPRDEHIADNAGEELATLRAQLQEAVKIIKTMKIINAWSSVEIDYARQLAKEYLDKVTPVE